MSWLQTLMVLILALNITLQLHKVIGYLQQIRDLMVEANNLQKSRDI